MANTIVNDSGWSLPESHDLGIHYFYRDLLKGNPIRERFFKQTLANIDRMNMANKFDYETMRPKMKSVIGKTMVYFDQVQTMIMSANLPKEIEDDLFYHLDYHTTTRPQTICFLKVKEFFAYCGIEGVYDIENKRHFLVPYEPAHVVDHLNFEKWLDEPEDRLEMFREKYARMIAEPGEVPDYAQDLRDMQDDLNIAHMEAFYESDYSRLEKEVHDQVFIEPIRSPEHFEELMNNARAKGLDVDGVERERLAFIETLPSHPIYGPLIKMHDDMIAEEKAKLEAAKEKYAHPEWLKNPESFYAFDDKIGERGRGWDTRTRRHMRDKDYWANAFWNTSKQEDYPNHELSDEEIQEAKAQYSGLIELKDYYKVRYYLDRKIFERDVYPSLNTRRCAFEDWALRGYTMSPLNRGVIAEARREDVPVIFAQAVRDEMNDGLMEAMKFPTRIERTNDNSGEYNLFLNGEWVERFHPDSVLPLLSKSWEVNKDPEKTAINHKAKSDKVRGLMLKAGLPVPEQQDKNLDFKISTPALDMIDAVTASPASGLSADDQARMERSRQNKKEFYKHLNMPEQDNDPLADYDPDKPVGINAQTQKSAGQKKGASKPAHKDEKKNEANGPGQPAPRINGPGMAGAAMAAGRGGMPMMGGMPMIGINLSGLMSRGGNDGGGSGDGSDDGHTPWESVSQARGSAAAHSGPDADPSRASSRWNQYAQSLNKLGTNIGDHMKAMTPDQAKSAASKLGDEMRKGLDLIKRAANANVVPQKLLQECRKSIDAINQFIRTLMQTLGRLFGSNSGPAPAI